MRLYIIAAALFVTAFMIIGVLTAGLINPTPPPAKPHAAAAPPRSSGGEYGSQAPSEPTYPAAMPAQRARGTPGATPAISSGMPSLNSTMPGMPSTGMPPGPSGVSGISGPIGISAPPAIPVPKPSSIEPTNSVPIIQPTDLGIAPTPTAGKQHQ